MVGLEAKLLRLSCILVVLHRTSSQSNDPCTNGETYGGNDNPKHCYFPFIYKGVTYNECTSADHNRKWCSTTPDYTNDKKWGNCDSNIDTRWGSANPARCVFPFTYKGVRYEECTKINNDGVNWCATTSNYDGDKLWGNCKGDPKSPPGGTGADGAELFGLINLGSTKTYEGTANPARCVFPFTYRGTTYNECTSVNAKNPWCSTTADYEKDRKWGYCWVPTYDGSANPVKCVFPFWYKDMWYDDCTTRNNYGREWCATTDNYPRDLSWANCDNTHGGNDRPDGCTFPFIYKSVSYDTCITANSRNNQLWCATSPNYDDNGKWGYCQTDCS